MTLYEKMLEQIDYHMEVPYEADKENGAKGCERVAIQEQIDLLNKMRDVLDIPQDQHERFMEEVQLLEKQLL